MANSFKIDALDALRNAAETDRHKALASLKIMLNHPAGIGDHSTSDLHDNLNEALQQLVDADDRLETLRKYFKELTNG
jgi:hypothetical protein|tara:strand:+ start:43 stop:276 length:234 start_codon:yes stop_codon:yes gene_type:complete